MKCPCNALTMHNISHSTHPFTAWNIIYPLLLTEHTAIKCNMNVNIQHLPKLCCKLSHKAHFAATTHSSKSAPFNTLWLRSWFIVYGFTFYQLQGFIDYSLANCLRLCCWRPWMGSTFECLLCTLYWTGSRWNADRVDSKLSGWNWCCTQKCWLGIRFLHVTP